MGMNSISFVAEKLDDNELKDNLSFQYTQYGQVMDRVNKLYENYGEIPEEKNIMNKVMGWTGVQMNTINDKSPSKIAEIMIEGTTIGIIEGRKIINHEADQASKDVRDLLNNFVTFQENNVEQLKKFYRDLSGFGDGPKIPVGKKKCSKILIESKVQNLVFM